jgi:hypothetical protein
VESPRRSRDHQPHSPPQLPERVRRGRPAGPAPPGVRAAEPGRQLLKSSKAVEASTGTAVQIGWSGTAGKGSAVPPAWGLTGREWVGEVSADGPPDRRASPRSRERPVTPQPRTRPRSARRPADPPAGEPSSGTRPHPVRPVAPPPDRVPGRRTCRCCAPCHPYPGRTGGPAITAAAVPRVDNRCGARGARSAYGWPTTEATAHPQSTGIYLHAPERAARPSGLQP